MGEYDPDFWYKLLGGTIQAIVYGVLGIVLTMLGFKVFDWITPKIDIQRELAEKHNVAIAVVCAAVILGVGAIVIMAIR